MSNMTHFISSGMFILNNILFSLKVFLTIINNNIQAINDIEN
tara:strand:- start:891 stop:1016 length:126 start_codon:yes stop_codon:yes gene_type:complete